MSSPSRAATRKKSMLRRQPKRSLTVEDVSIEGIEPVDETALEVPSLTETRMYTINDGIDRAFNNSQIRENRFVWDLAASERPGTQTPQQQQKTNVHDDLALKLMAYYKRVHGQALRVHEELARNLKLNLADLVYAESRLTKTHGTPQGWPASMPPIVPFLLLLFTGDQRDVVDLLDIRENLLMESGGSGDAKDELIAKLTRKLDSLRRSKYQTSTEIAASHSNSVQAEIRQALTTRDPHLLARWIGCISILFASILHAGEEGFQSACGVAEPAVTFETLSRPAGASRRGFVPSLVLPAVKQVAEVDRVFAYTTLRCPTVDAALATLESIASVTTSITLPPFLPLALRNPRKTELKLKRQKGFNESSLVSETSPDVQRLRARVQGWTTQQGDAGATSFDVVLRLWFEPGHLVPLQNFSRYPDENEAVCLPFMTMIPIAFDPESLRLDAVVLRHESSLHNEIRIFSETVMSDAHKASATATRISSRLMQLFVQPHHCHRHPLQKFSHFCHDCRLFICPACCKEIHLPHKREPIAAFCVDESVRLNPKRQEILRRLATLHKLKQGLDSERRKMISLVETGVDEVLHRLKERRSALHVDVEERAAEQRRELARESVNAAVDRERIETAKLSVDKTKYGLVEGVPEVKLHERWQVKNNLDLKLPTDQLKKLVRLLTWSNPSKYLTNVVYPPEPEGQQ